MKRLPLLFLLLGAAATFLVFQGPIQADETPPFVWNDGDRVVLIGDTMIERDQKTGYLETLITAQNPGKTLTFRNLGWSGDTVLGLSRAGFGPPPDGFKQLKEHVLGLKPTVLAVGYGMAESFDNEVGLAAFVKGLNLILDTIAETKARLILLSPIAHEDLGRPLPDPTSHNASLVKFRDAIKTIAGERKGVFVDLFEPTLSAKDYGIAPLTDNGIHLTPYGQWYVASTIELDLRKIKRDPPGWQVRIAVEDQQPKFTQTKVSNLEATKKSVKFEAADETLPVPTPPADAPEAVVWMGGKRVLRINGLEPGRYTLKVDGKTIVTADQNIWDKGVPLASGPEFDQVEELRSAINRKNLLYFYRWRPQNETYLFGFRKHEQGNNAVEIPQFDPLVEEQEKSIAKLKQPVRHVYELTVESEVTK